MCVFYDTVSFNRQLKNGMNVDLRSSSPPFKHCSAEADQHGCHHA